MSFDKAKAMRNAERFLAQGKLRAAINEYQRVVDTDKTDYGTLNMLGDLYAKASEPDQAIACFTEVAEHYRKQGFAQKAIAIYNKISRLKPDLIEVSVKLAQLYQSKGSVAEARDHYTTLAEQYSRSGKKSEALEVWKQIANLDPNNTDIYLKIADGYWQDQQKEEAADAYIEAGNRLNTKQQYESAVTAFSRALEITPDNTSALKGFAESQINLGYSDEAAKTLESSIARQPHNRDLSFLLIDCYLDMGNLYEAEKTVIKLVEQEPSNYLKLLDLVNSYLKNSDLESAARILSMASEHLLVGGKAQALEELINEILARNPDHLETIRLQVRLYSWQRDETEIRLSLEKLAEVAKINNSAEDERYALEQLVMIVPQNAYFPERLQELNLSTGYSAEYNTKPRLNYANEVPSFESYAALGDHDAQPVQTGSVAVAEYESHTSNGNGHSNGFRFEDEGLESNTDEIIEQQPQAPRELSEFEIHNLQKELEGIDFYVAQGFVDLAEKAIKELEERFGKHPEIDKARETMGIPYSTSVEDFSSQVANQSLISSVEETYEGFEQFENAVEDNFSFETTASNSDYTIETFDSSQTLENFATAEESSVQDELKTETSEQDFVAGLENNLFSQDELASFEISADNNDPQSETAGIKSFDEFKSEMISDENQSQEEDSDFDYRYQMGIAYKEMGLMEDAIKELQEAIKVVSANDGTRRFFWCCNLLGHCFIEKGLPNIALMWYKRGLEAKYISQEEAQGLRYELANAYEMAGDKQMAIRYFEEIYAVSVGFRDVGKRLEKLMSN